MERLRVGVRGGVLRGGGDGRATYAAQLYRRLARELDVRVLRTDEDLHLLRANDLDVLHFPVEMGTSARPRLPAVVTVHGAPALPSATRGAAARSSAWTRRVGHAARSADAVVTSSESGAHRVVELAGVPQEKVHVIRHGVDHSRFHPRTCGDRALLAPLTLPERFLLYIGSLKSHRNVAGIVAALQEPPLAGLGISLVVAGGSPGLRPHTVLDMMAASGRTRYLGHVAPELVAPLMRAAAAFVLPSRYEGLGHTVAEAMACGTPVVCSQWGVPPEVTGNAAYRIADLSPRGIAHGVYDVLSDATHATELTAAGLARARRFSWARSARAHADLFEKVAGTR